MYKNVIDNVGILIRLFGNWKIYIVEDNNDFTYQGTVADLLW